MKILLINQPIENRGDESAHRGLVRALVGSIPAVQIVCVFLGARAESVRQMAVSSPNVKYVIIPMRRGTYRLPALALQTHLWRPVAALHPAYRQLKQYMRDADYVINAPGGICMGGFQSWGHILYLMLAREAGKPTAYYSRSFGPFRIATRTDRLFKRYSLSLLKSFDFLSIRDQKTMELADNLGLHYVPAIDTAFLHVPEVVIPTEVREATGTDYTVFVPNSLVWHTDYHRSDSSRINNFFLKTLDLLLAKRPESKIVMLPQLYNLGDLGDEPYFESLRCRSSLPERIVVLPDSIGSDIQQAIIAKAGFVVGARYHTIVFAINNRVPFVAFTYEHKIAGLLDVLHLEDRQIDIGDLGKSTFDDSATFNALTRLLNHSKPLDVAANRARKIANDCFQALITRLTVAL